MSPLLHCVVAAAVASFAAAGARAEVVDFDGVLEPFENVESFDYGPLTFASDSGYLGVQVGAPDVGPFGGTPYLIDSRGVLTITHGGKPFVVDSFAIAQSWFTVRPEATVTVTYDFWYGGEEVRTLTLSQAAFTSVASSIPVAALRIDSRDASLGGGYFALDDIAVTQVPEPATWASFGAGIALLAALRRRRAGG